MEEFYFLQSKYNSIMTRLTKSNKGWKRLFVHVTNPNGFGVSMRWKMTDVGGNRAFAVMPEEEKDFDKLLGCKFL